MVAILVLLLTLAIHILGQGEVGQRCRMSVTGLPGLCTPGRDCASANKLAMQGVNPSICSFDNDDLPIVCCDVKLEPRIVPNARRINNPVITRQLDSSFDIRISEQKCSEYSRLVSDKVDFSTLIIGDVPKSHNYSKCDKDGIPLIVGGTPAALGELPFMAAIGFKKGGESVFGCGATLISNQFVLTAAHCSYHRGLGAAVFVRLGDLNLESSSDGATPVDIPIATFIKHPSYKSNENYDDIALVKLVRNVQFTNNVRPACLWHSNSIKTTKALAAGWGQIALFTEDPSPKLLKVGLNLYPLDRCELNYTQKDRKLPRGVVDTMLCAGELKGGKDTCQGDSGGPLFITNEDNNCVYYTVGVTSFGKFCALPDTPAIYTKVASYISWIEGIVWT